MTEVPARLRPVVQRRDPYAAPVAAQRRPPRVGTTATVMARFQKKVAGYGDGLADIDRIPHPKVPQSKQPKAVTKEEER